MKKISLVLAFLAAISTHTFSQNFDLSILDKAGTLINDGHQKKAGLVLSDALMGIKDEVSGTSNSFTPKVLSQVSALSSFIPALKSGNANVSGIQKIISLIKTAVAAQRLKGMLNGGGLLGKSSQLQSNVGILQSGLSMLGNSGSTYKVSKLLNVVGKKSGKLDGSGFGAKLAEKAVSKKLGSSLNLIEGLL